MRKSLFFLSVLFSALIFWQCQPRNDFKVIYDLKNSEWPIDSLQKFTFEIEDVTLPYNFYYLIRNAQQYPFYNLYVKRTLSDSTGKALSESLEEVILFDTKTGKPLGKGLGDIFDHKLRLRTLSNYRFSKAGTYTFTIEQNMRQDPLLGIMSVGLSVEQVVEKP